MIDLLNLRKDFGMNQKSIACVMGTSVGRASMIERNLWPISETEVSRLIEKFGYGVAKYFHEGLSLKEEINNRRKQKKQEIEDQRKLLQERKRKSKNNVVKMDTKGKNRRKKAA